MTKLVLWRHGVTDWNQKNMFQGQTDIPLNDDGLRQAGVAAPYLNAMRPSAIYCSPMLRAQQTAAALARLTGQQVVLDARLAEIDVGTWVGLNLSKVIADDPVLRATVRAGHDYRRSPTGETMTEVGLRAGQCLREIASAHEGDTVVVVSHGGAIRMGMAAILEWSHEMAYVLGGLANCSWSVLGQRYDRWRIDSYNCSAMTPDPSVNTEI